MGVTAAGRRVLSVLPKEVPIRSIFRMEEDERMEYNLNVKHIGSLSVYVTKCCRKLCGHLRRMFLITEMLIYFLSRKVLSFDGINCHCLMMGRF